MSYHYYIIKTHRATGGGSSASVRASPISGQGLSTSLKVECSRSMRHNNKTGTLFKLRAKVIDREGTKILYSHYNESYEIITESEAEDYIAKYFSEHV